MYFHFRLIGLVTIIHKKYMLTLFVDPEYWQWGYKHVTQDVFPYWESKSFSLGPPFSLYILLTNMEEWFKLKK